MSFMFSYIISPSSNGCLIERQTPISVIRRGFYATVNGSYIVNISVMQLLYRLSKKSLHATVSSKQRLKQIFTLKTKIKSSR